MTSTLPHDFATLARAWRELQMCTPVKLATVEDDRHYRAMVNFLNKLLDEIGDRETHPLIGLLEVAGCFVREYEESNINIPGPRQLEMGNNVSASEPGETFAGLDGESAELEAEFRAAAAAAKWYEVGRVSQEVAAQIAGVSRSEFLTILSRLQVSSMQESAEEALASARLLLQP